MLTKVGFSGPSGVGKTTIINELLKMLQNFKLLKSYTTRSQRFENENEYNFVCKHTFCKLKDQDFFLEYEEIFENYYGTEKIKDDFIFINKDIKGMLNLKTKIDIFTIGILPPSINELKNRLNIRNENEIEKRMDRIKFELQNMIHLDYLIINDNLQNTINNIFNIITIHKNKLSLEEKEILIKQIS